MLTSAEAAKYVGVTADQMSRLARQGKVRAEKVVRHHSVRGKDFTEWFYDQESLDEYRRTRSAGRLKAPEAKYDPAIWDAPRTNIHGGRLPGTTRYKLHEIKFAREVLGFSHYSIAGWLGMEIAHYVRFLGRTVGGAWLAEAELEIEIKMEEVWQQNGKSYVPRGGRAA